jgi:hypothetical protein
MVIGIFVLTATSSIIVFHTLGLPAMLIKLLGCFYINDIVIGTLADVD